MKQGLWKIVGTAEGRSVTIRVRADDYFHAVKLANHRRIKIRDCVLIEDRSR